MSAAAAAAGLLLLPPPLHYSLFFLPCPAVHPSQPAFPAPPPLCPPADEAWGDLLGVVRPGKSLDQVLAAEPLFVRQVLEAHMVDYPFFTNLWPPATGGAPPVNVFAQLENRQLRVRAHGPRRTVPCMLALLRRRRACASLAVSGTAS